MNRRGFLKSILAAAVAPAIVKADNLMKLYVPNQDLVFDGVGDYLILPDTTIESVVKNPLFDEWTHIALVRKSNEFTTYINGVESKLPNSISFLKEFYVQDNRIVSPEIPKDTYLGELRITSGFARTPDLFLYKEDDVLPEPIYKAVPWIYIASGFITAYNFKSGIVLWRRFKNTQY